MRRLALLAAFACLALPVAGTGARAVHVKIFLLQGEQLSAVPRAVAADAKPIGAIRALLAGPNARERNAGYRSAIPAGTRLVRLTSSTTRAVVSLRAPVQKPGTFTASLLPARAAQVAFTLKALGFDQVALIVNGHMLATPHSAQPAIPLPESPPDLELDVAAPDDVLLVQTQLNSLRFLPKGAITGTWDYRTEQAVLAAQAWNGLDRDGIVGSQTLGALAEGQVPRFSWSVPYKVWLPWASYFHNGVAFHAYPEIPATPASHGCVRVSYPKAATVYAFATVGTPVYVY